MEESKYYMNPLWRALDEIETLILKKQDDDGKYDPVTLSDGETLALDHVASTIGNAEDETNERKIKASFLLGLAVGLKHAEFPREKIQKLIDSCKTGL